MTTLTTAAATSAGTRWEGGHGTAFAQGTFGSGTLTIQASFDGTTWITITGVTAAAVSLTAAGMFPFRLPPCLVRGVLTGSTDATVDFDLLHS